MKISSNLVIFEHILFQVSIQRFDAISDRKLNFSEVQRLFSDTLSGKEHIKELL